MNSFPHFHGNAEAAHTLAQMIKTGRISQTILLSGPEGIGKATLARRFAAALLGSEAKIEADDLSLPANQDAVEGREKWAADKRNDDPLFFSTHPDFVTFAPDGPLRQVTIQQMRLLRERAQLKPLDGPHRVFLIDHIERANEQAANSLLKVLEEPPAHLVVLATTENLYDLLPTIRSRAVVLQLHRLSDQEMQAFAQARRLPDAEVRIALAEGSPGLAASLDVEQFRERRSLLLAAFECGSGLTPFSGWVGRSETFNASRSDKLEFYLKPAYGLLEDLLSLMVGRTPQKNRDVVERMRKIGETVDFGWIEQAVRCLDELVDMVRRNIQKTAALDAMIIVLRNASQKVRA